MEKADQGHHGGAGSPQKEATEITLKFGKGCVGEELAKNEGVTEQLKSDDWLCWLRKMNSIRNRAEKVVLHDLIYSL